MIDFVNLHVHSSYSILDSLISVKELFTTAKTLGQTAVAITDHGSIASASDALKASKETGVKLIMGLEAYFINDVSQKEDRFRHIILLAKNAVGYKNLLSLNKEGFDNAAIFAKRVYPLIDWKLLEKYREGLICLTSCSNGIIAQLLMTKQFDEAEKQLLRLQSIFGDDLGLEVQANTLKRSASAYNDVIEQVFVNAQIVKLARKHNIRAVATSNAHYIKKEDHETHDVLMAIGSHQPIYSNFRLRYTCPDFYLKTGEEVCSFFERNYGEEYAKELCSNSIFFADRCEFPAWIDPKFSNPTGKELPEFPCKDEIDYSEFQQWQTKQTEAIRVSSEDRQFLRYRCSKFLAERITNGSIDLAKLEEYHSRIAEELDVFEFHDFSSYMLIVADYIAWARANKIIVGVGRGSVGGSIIGFLLGIHQADPVKYDLIFARFHNKEKSSFPDIDTDFSDRDRVEAYCRQKYGDDHVARVSNLITMTPKVFAKDIARACEFGGSREEAVQVGIAIADTLPAEVKSIEAAFKHIPLFEEYAKKYSELKKHSAICGSFRAWGTHAAGIVISKRPLTGLVPLRRDKDGILCLEYDKDRAEENGLVKMDLLGLSTLNVIENIHKLIIRNGKLPPPEPNYDAYDQDTYNLISRGDTFGIFQLGTSSGTIDLCKRIAPKSLNDISYINALTRPAAKDIRNDFILTKDGKKAFSLLHPKMARAFNNTFGFGLYEESLFFLAQDVAGWNMHSADRLRKMTKDKGKNPEKIAKLRDEFIKDAIGNTVNPEIAKRIWEETISNFGGYGFNSSHSIFYSMLGYTEAYLKSHYPIEFLLAKLMDEIKSTTPAADSNIAKFKNEIRSHKIKIVHPDINQSELRYVMRGNQLITGLDALKFVSDDAVRDIIAKRPFTSFQDFMSRVDSRTVRANTIQALAAAGCLEMFGIPRHLIFLYCSDYRKKLQVWSKKHDPTQEQFVYPFPEEESVWTKPQMYAQEVFYLGEGFSCSKKEAYGQFFKEGGFDSLGKVKKAGDREYFRSIKAIVVDSFLFKVKKANSKYVGQEMAKLVIEDINGERCGLTVFPDRWMRMQARIKELLGAKFKFEPGAAIHFSGTSNLYEEEIGMIMDQLINIVPAPQRPIDLQSKKINLRLKKGGGGENGSGGGAIGSSPMALFSEMEDFMFDAGLIDLDDENLG